jgi:hypothetical protein
MIVTKIDLTGDWLILIKQELTELGYDLTGLSDDKISILYFSLQKRLITQIPRDIKKSSGFNCPIDLIPGLDLLERKIKNGEDLKPHLTRKLKNLDDIDGLLYDWDIFHLHLGVGIETDGFVKRTGPLLYAKFDNKTAYFIGIYSHGAWTMQEMIRIMHNDWPESIECYRLKGVVGLETSLNDEDIKHLRGAFYNPAIEVEPGVVYIGPGGGFAASGDSIDAVERFSSVHDFLTDLQMNLKEKTEPYLKSLFKKTDFIKNDNLEFQLIKKNGRLFVYENNNGFYLELKN